MSPPLVLYDGDCPLCRGLVRFFRKRTRNSSVRYVASDSEFGHRIAARHHLEHRIPVTMVVVEERRILVKSDAVIALSAHLSGVWKGLGTLRFFPKPIRDGAYDWIARHRYWWRQGC